MGYKRSKTNWELVLEMGIPHNILTWIALVIHRCDYLCFVLIMLPFENSLHLSGTYFGGSWCPCVLGTITLFSVLRALSLSPSSTRCFSPFLFVIGFSVSLHFTFLLHLAGNAGGLSRYLNPPRTKGLVEATIHLMRNDVWGISSVENLMTWCPLEVAQFAHVCGGTFFD